MSTLPRVTVRTRAGVANIVPRTLGFVPTDSLVILGTGGAPTARVDLVDSAALASGLAPAAEHWRRSPCIVIVYGTAADLERIARDLGEILPDVRPVDVFAVRDAHTVGLDGTRAPLESWTPTGTDLDARTVAFDRGALAEHADSVTDADTAVTLAEEAWLAGAGALAWTFLDRARALGATGARLDALDSNLTQAVDPRTAS